MYTEPFGTCFSIILAGGAGTRLFPESRKTKPKFLLSFDRTENGCETLLQSTVRRLSGLIPPQNVRIVTGESLLAAVQEDLPDVPAAQIWTEPMPRNTAAAIGLAAVKLCRESSDAVMIILPADHVIQPADVFCRTIETAIDIVTKNKDAVITFGIKPDFPSTAYGYMERREKIGMSAAVPAFHVRRFCEKPAKPIAEQFLQVGNFYWNSGVFVWRAETILALLCRFEPVIGEQLARIAAAAGTPEEVNVTKNAFELMPSVPIDCAVLERAETVIVLEAPFEWNDVGTWSALDRLYADKKDAAGNIAVNAAVCAVHSANCTVKSVNPQHLIALVGIDNVAVIQTEDATLIVRKDQEDLVRRIAEHF